MSSNVVNEDIRSIKTEKALFAAMFSLLKKQSFRKITIKGICEEALISRAAFYAHFVDKYDLLKHWMPELWPKSLSGDDSYEQLEKAFNDRIRENMQLLKNLMDDADRETYGVLFDYLLTTINLENGHDHGDEIHSKNTVVANFYAGGIISYLLWQIDNRFPSEVPPVNPYLLEIVSWLQEWRSK